MKSSKHHRSHEHRSRKHKKRLSLKFYDSVTIEPDKDFPGAVVLKAEKFQLESDKAEFNARVHSTLGFIDNKRITLRKEEDELHRKIEQVNQQISIIWKQLETEKAFYRQNSNAFAFEIDTLRNENQYLKKIIAQLSNPLQMSPYAKPYPSAQYINQQYPQTVITSSQPNMNVTRGNPTEHMNGGLKITVERPNQQPPLIPHPQVISSSSSLPSLTEDITNYASGS